MGDPDALAAAYQDLPPWNFSRDFLAHVSRHLIVTRTDGLGWSDWGTVGAIERTLASLGQAPPWHTVHAMRATA